MASQELGKVVVMRFGGRMALLERKNKKKFTSKIYTIEPSKNLLAKVTY
tara:strand:+ start:335 stop:481 length:147 start_codon:yes stop_codon:yes gene_type:complete